MDYAEAFRRILTEYFEEVEGVERKKRPYDGIFGLGRSPADDPCHELLDRKVAELAGRALGEIPEEGGEARSAEPEEADALVNALMRSAAGYRGPNYAGMTLVAIQRHGLPLIPRMSPGGRRELADWYEKEYPKRTRFPIQKDICKALRRA